MLTTVERVLLLRAVDVFADVPTEALAAVAAIGTELDLAAGTTLYRAGDDADALYIVIEGAVTLGGSHGVVTKAGPEEAFGTWSLFDVEQRLAEAVAESSCRLLRVGRDDFVEVLADNVEVTRGVLRGLSRRLRTLASRVSVSRVG